MGTDGPPRAAIREDASGPAWSLAETLAGLTAGLEESQLRADAMLALRREVFPRLRQAWFGAFVRTEPTPEKLLAMWAQARVIESLDRLAGAEQSAALDHMRELNEQAQGGLRGAGIEGMPDLEGGDV